MVDIKDILGGIIEIETSNKGRKTVHEHYGVNDKQLEKIAKGMLIDFINLESKIEVLDKNFKTFSAEDRVKVLAFANALDLFEKLNKRWK